MIAALEPEVPAEEDTGGVAQFMLDLSSKADVDESKESTETISVEKSRA